jgi:hypothetical protein
MTDFDRQRLRVEALEKPLRRERRTQCHLVGRGGRERRQAAGGAHDCPRQGAPRQPLLLRFVEALSTPVVGPVMGLFGGRRDSLFVNAFK